MGFKLLSPDRSHRGTIAADLQPLIALKDLSGQRHGAGGGIQVVLQMKAFIPAGYRMAVAMQDQGASLARRHQRWGVFPQIKGLGISEIAHHYSIKSRLKFMMFHLHSWTKAPVFRANLIALFVGVLVANPGSAQTGRQNPMPHVPEGTTVYKDIPYITNGTAKQKLDLYIPKEGRNFPLIIWVHGGAWMTGSKNLEAQVPLNYLREGYAVASIEYRFSQNALFPAQIEDCKAGVRWLRANAAKYKLNPDRFAAWGPSAGGHLVAMLGTTGNVKEFDVGENLNVSSRVQAVVDYFGPADLLQMSGHLGPGSPESNLIGGAVKDNPGKANHASPVTYVTKDAPPFLIAHGDADPAVPYHQSELLTAALQKAGVAVTLYTVKGAGHGLGILKDPRVNEMTKAFLAKYLKETGP